MRKTTTIGVSASRQFVLMSICMQSIGNLRVMHFGERYNELVYKFAMVLESFGQHGHSLLRSAETKERLARLLVREAAFQVMSTPEDHVRLKNDWNEFNAGILGQLGAWAVSPFAIANYQYKLKNFVTANATFREEILKETMRIGPVLLQDIGDLIASNHLGVAADLLGGLMISLEARANELFAEHSTPVKGAAFELPL